MTTPSVSNNIVVDSSGWIEYIASGPKCTQYSTHIESQTAILLMPSIVAYEVYKKLLREASHSVADQFFSKAIAFDKRLISLDLDIALKAARMSVEDNLPMADAIIYATARHHDAQLITSDSHFRNLPHVKFI